MERPNQKYIVFNREDWFSGVVADELGQDNAKRIASKCELTDGVVIRAQDVFAASTFFNYANTVQTSIEILQGTFAEDPELQRQLETLQNIADHFHELGVWASSLPNTKMPD